MLGDTILAVASAPGASERAVIRLSGPRARRAVAQVFSPQLPEQRAVVDGVLTLLAAPLPALAISMPEPRSYTGEDVVELHVPGSPVLCAWILERLAESSDGAVRPALPGEFTARAVQNGKLDLARAEGVYLLIHAEAVEEAARGAEWLRGGLSASVARARSRVQDALALLEVGLDFEAGETGSVPTAAIGEALGAAAVALAELASSLPVGRRGGELLLLGRSNAGKSSLANALAGRPAVLVDEGRGTTRDLVRVELANGASLWDGPGDLDEPGELDRLALQARDAQARSAAGALLVVDPEEPPRVGAAGPESPQGVPVVAAVFSKADRRPLSDPEIQALRRHCGLDDAVPHFAVSSETGIGLEALRGFLQAWTTANGASSSSPLDGSAAVRLEVQRARTALARAASAPAPELAGQDLQDVLAALGAIDGSHGVDDLLDRIYGRFCLGK